MHFSKFYLLLGLCVSAFTFVACDDDGSSKSVCDCSADDDDCKLNCARAVCQCPNANDESALMSCAQSCDCYTNCPDSSSSWGGDEECFVECGAEKGRIKSPYSSSPSSDGNNRNENGWDESSWEEVYWDEGDWDESDWDEGDWE